MIEDPMFYSFSSEEFKAWIYILSQASQKNSAEVFVNFDHADRACGIKQKYMESAIEKLEQNQAITISRSSHDRDTNANVLNRAATYKQTNIHNTSSDEDSLRNSVEAKDPVPSELVELWNDMRHPDLPEVIALPPRRSAMAKARLAENPSIEFWVDLIERINNSKFCTGKIKPTDRAKAWKADFDWMIKPDTATKILEGKYDNK